MVLRLGSSGAPVRELQRALGIEEDGRFGPETQGAVEAFQQRSGLPVDGVVGKRTWAALEAARDARPRVQKTGTDRIIDRVVDSAAKGGPGAGIGAGGAWLLDKAPEGAMAVLLYGGAVLAVALGAVLVVKFLRRAS